MRSRNWNYQTPWVNEDPAADGNRGALSPPELYDLNADPDELKNVVNEHPEIAAEYRGLLAAYIEENRPVTGGSLEVGEAALSHVPLFDQSRL